MKKFEIKKNYDKKIKEYLSHNRSYYEKSEPTISDAEYDNLKKEILDLENNYVFLRSKFSPSIIVGSSP